MSQDFRRVAIANRGHVAMRFIHSVREFNREHGTAVETVAMHTDPERDAPYVREADASVSLGASSFVDPHDGRRRSRYVDLARMRAALTSVGADAVWVGWGFVPEHIAFAELCAELGIAYIGPSPAVLRRLSDKIETRRLAAELGLATVPWSERALSSVEDAKAAAEALGYPVFVKAAMGGAGRTLGVAYEPMSLAALFERVRAEASRTLGDDRCLVERALPGTRLITAQVLADAHGTVWDVGLREGSVQRAFGKIVDEAPPVALPPSLERAARDGAVSLMRAAGFCGVGSVEFLADAAGERLWLLEVNPRLETAHDVMEATTGIDLVKHQLLVARGARLDGPAPAQNGHAMEVRLRAQDPDRGFAPAPGVIDAFRAPTGPGLRVEASVADGEEVPPGLSTLIAKLVAFGRNRVEALTRMERALRDCVVVVRGGATNKSDLLSLLTRDEVRAGPVDIDWLDALDESGALRATPHADVALIVAAIEQHDREFEESRAAFALSASRGSPVVPPEIGRRVELWHSGHTYRFHVARVDADRYTVEVDGRGLAVRYKRQGRFERRLDGLGSARRHIVASAHEFGHVVEVDGFAHTVYRDEGGVVRAPAPGIVQSIARAAGDVVEVGAPLAVLEAMKMEMTITAPFAGRVREVYAVGNVPVATGAPLLFLEGVKRESAHAMTPRVRFETSAAPSSRSDQERWLGALASLSRVVLGYDVDAAESRRLLAECASAAKSVAATDPEVIEAERALLARFESVATLFRRRPGAGDEGDGEAYSAEEYLITFLRTRDPSAGRLPAAFFDELRAALAHYGVDALTPSASLDAALYWICKSHQRADLQAAPAAQILDRWLARAEELAPRADVEIAALLERVVRATRGRQRALAELAQEASYRLFARPAYEQARARAFEDAAKDLDELARGPSPVRRAELARRLMESPYPLADTFAERFESASPALREQMLDVLAARYYRHRGITRLAPLPVEGFSAIAGEYRDGGEAARLVMAAVPVDALSTALRGLRERLAEGSTPSAIDVIGCAAGEARALTPSEISALLAESDLPASVRRVSFTLSAKGEARCHRMTFVRGGDGFAEEPLYRGLHPMVGERVRVSQLREFQVERLPSVDDVYLFRGVARANPRDERVFAFAEVRDLTPVLEADGRIQSFPHFERLFQETLAALRVVQSERPASRRLHWNRIEFDVWPVIELARGDLLRLCEKLSPATEGLGLEKVVLRGLLRDVRTGAVREREVHISKPTGMSVRVEERDASDEPIPPMSEYEQKVVRLRQRGVVYPHELVKMLTPSRDAAGAAFPPGDFRELDLDAGGRLAPVERAPGLNKANVIVGLIRSYTARYPEGVERVVVLGDGSRNLGALAEPECARIMAALDLAAERKIPLEWFALSSGARIAMESGTENMDWIAAVLRRLIEFTQAGGEVNVVVMGINVGAQPYWNAEATMLMHTRGVLIMMPGSAMVLTGKRALDYSGGLSAEDDLGIGGYDRIMGVNGQGQYVARDVSDACRILLAHYEHAYVHPGERFPRRVETTDPRDRDVCESPHGGALFDRVGDVFSDEKNPGRKKPFHIRRVMAAVIDQDRAHLERWQDMRDAEVAVVWDAHLGGFPVCVLGIESEPIKRQPPIPADGPEQWTGGTLFPQASKKVARAINAASDSRPVVILANLSGFDGSPESMRSLQLEFGAEIGRAVVNFRGPIVFCVVSRMHGGAYVVFSRTLNDNLEVAALEGTFASVIGGAPAAGVVFAGEVAARAQADARVKALEAEIAAASDADKRKLRARLQELVARVRAEKVGEMAEEFDREHSVQRALRVGSLHKIIPARTLRPYLIDALERGVARELARVGRDR